MSQRKPKSVTRPYHSFEYAIEDTVFNALFLMMLLVGAVVSQYLQHVRVQRPVYIPKPGPIKVTQVILREPEAPKPLPVVETKPVALPPTGTGPKLSAEEIRKRRTSPPPLSAVGSPKNLPSGEGGSVQKMVARKGLLGLLSKAETDTALRAYQPSKKKDVSDELNKALKNLSGPGGQKGTGEEDDFLGVGNLPEVAKKGTDIGYILNASKIGEVKETQVEFYGGTEDLPERLEKLPEEKIKSEDGVTVEGKPGGRTYNQIRKIVASYLGGLRYLYNKELRTNPSLKGKITVAFEISPDGVVTRSLMLGSSVGSRTFEEMVLENIRKWKFPSIPEQNGNVKVTYPFVFLPPSS